MRIAHSSGVNGPKKACGCEVHPTGPVAAKQSINSPNRPCSTAKSRSSFITSSGMLGNCGASAPCREEQLALWQGPIIRPTNALGGRICPIAISIPAEQCASICAGLILPHTRWLSGCRCSSRCFTSSTLDVSKEFPCFSTLPFVKNLKYDRLPALRMAQPQIVAITPGLRAPTRQC